MQNKKCKTIYYELDFKEIRCIYKTFLPKTEKNANNYMWLDQMSMSNHSQNKVLPPPSPEWYHQGLGKESSLWMNNGAYHPAGVTNGFGREGSFT